MRLPITKQKLNHALAVLNKTMGNTPHNAFFIQGAYGGFQLMRMIPGTTAADSITTGFVPKRELFAIVCGMSTALALYQEKLAIEERLNSLVDNFSSP
jgi:hypothetical protein